MLFPPSVCMISLVNDLAEEHSARLLVKSLRTFGGELASIPVWIFFPPTYHPSGLQSGLEDVHLFPLELTGPCQNYLFADKVFACAQAEAMTGRLVNTLIWMNPGCLVTRPPLLFDLDPAHDAAFRPVHLRNVGSPASQPLDAFWSGIYRAVNLEKAPYSITSYTDFQHIRPYFNTHCFSIHAKQGYLRAWWEHFEALALDVDFQASACQDQLHRIFLHQAVFSALIARDIPQERLDLLPAEYSYPLHLHDRVPEAIRPQYLNQLICPVYEDSFEFPATLNGMEVQEPLASWLRDNRID